MSNPSQPFEGPLRFSVYDAMFYSLMVGLGESYLSAYALSLGVSEAQTGLVSVVPMLFGAALQLFANYGVRCLRSRRKWIVGCAIAQSLALLGLAQLPRWNLDPKILPTVICAFACVYWASGLSGGPTWNLWISKIVPTSQRLSFFASRSRIAQMCVLVGLLTTGLCLEYFSDKSLVVFSWLFFAASIMRLISAGFIYFQDECGTMADHVQSVNTSIFERGMRLISMNKAMLLMIIYLFAVNIAVHVSGPFFSPYMLKQLRFGFIEYTILISASFLARILANNLFVYLARSRGVKSLLYFGIIGIMPLPLLWTLDNTYAYILILQIWSGCVWGAHELGVTLFVLESYEEHQRSVVLTLANLCNCIAMFLGGLIGATILTRGIDPAYHEVFTASTALRTLPIFILFAMGTLPLRVKVKHLWLRIISVRPGSGVIAKPILYTESNEDHAK